MAKIDVNPLPKTDRHPLDDEMQEMQAFVRQMEEELRRNAKLPPSEDPLFKNVPVYKGPARVEGSEV
jgi:hypothetical protein